MKRIAVPTIVAVILLATITAGVEDRPLLGPDTWPKPAAELGEEYMAFHQPSFFYQNEYTGAMFFSKDGWKFVANIFYFKLGPELKWGITVSVADPKNNYFIGKAEIDPTLMKFDPNSAEISFKDSYIKGRNPNYHIHYVTDKVTVDLNYKSRVGVWAPAGAGRFKLGAEGKYYYNWAMGAPWADVTGSITINGKTYPVEGQGYVDHGHWSVPYNKHNPIWEGFQAWTWEPLDGHMWSVQVFDVITHPAFGGKRLGVALVIMDDRILCATPKYKITPGDFRRDSRTGVEFPWRFTVNTWPDAPCSISGVSNAKYSWEILDIFDELPAYLRPIIKKFLNRPVYLRAFGEFKGSVTCGDQKLRLDLPAFHDANYVR